MITHLGSYLRRFLCEEEATTTVEYAVMLMLIIGGCVTVVQALGSGSSGLWANNSTQLNGVLGS
ncbi:MAG: Flp family type IVb pilin [Planctomycetales bacterium]|nr:Flp family type IVb pilin [Planctomycetales bacterium]